MKKSLFVVLTVVVILSLCACGKSEEVKNVESQIATLTKNSTYQEIHNVYSAFVALDFDDREKVENADLLAEYCNGNGCFVLTDSMVKEIEGYFKNSSSFGFPKVLLQIDSEFQIEKWIGHNDWQDYSNIKIATIEKTDKYTYVGYGSMNIQDKYGEVTKHKFEISYHAEFYEKNEQGYRIYYDAKFKQQQ